MKLKRLVSAVLAVGMALTMLPTAAFAATSYTPLTDLTLDGNGYINGKANFNVSKLLREDLYGGGTVYSNVGVYNGKIENGTFRGRVNNFGVIETGDFYDVQNGAFYSPGNGSISKAVMRNYTVKHIEPASDYPTYGTTKVENSIIWGAISIDYSMDNTIDNCVISEIPEGFTEKNNGPKTYQTFTAKGAIIKPVDTRHQLWNLPSEAVFDGVAYVIGNDPITRKFEVTPASPAFETWDSDDIAKAKADGATVTEDPDTHVLTVVLPDSGADVSIKAHAPRMHLTAGVVNGKVVPVYEGKPATGSRYDGWFYSEDADGNGILKIYDNSVDDYAIDLGNAEVDWKIENEGVIKGGIFNYADNETSVLTNTENGKIIGGTFNVKVTNNGVIEGGTFNNNVNNYNEVNGGTFTARYYNSRRKDTVNGELQVVALGKTNGGVFSRYADFYGQGDIKYSTVTLNNCTANGISGMVNVVGKQTLNVEADTTSWTGWEVTADPSYEEAITKQVGSTSAFDLTLNGDDEWSVTLTAQVKEGYYRMNLTDGTAANADGTEITSAKAGDTVTLTAADAPDGMVFDRWEITPSDVALTLEEAGFDSHAAIASFKMPAQTLNIRAMYRMADQPEEPNVLGTVAMVATAGVGAAVVGYTGYMIGTELYLNTVLPEGTAIPNNTTELAVLVWTDAGKPAPAAVLAADATDEQKALTWAVENQLISADKAADASVGRWEVIDAWNKAQEMKKA